MFFAHLLFFSVFTLWLGQKILLRHWKISKLPPGPTPFPFIGNVLAFDLANPHHTFVALVKQFGPVFTVHLPDPVVVVADPTQFAVLKRNCTAGRPEGFLYGLFTGHKPQGDGIILCEGEVWNAQRRFALATFKEFGMGRSLMADRINFHSDLLLDRLFALCQFDGKAEVDLHLHISFCIGNIINDLVMGRHYPFGDPEFLRFKHLLDSTLEGFASASLQFVDTFPWLRWFVPAFWKYRAGGFRLQKFFLDEIERHEREFREETEPSNFIDAYLREMRNGNEQHLSKLTLALDAGDLWTGGLETTVTTLRWAILYLIHNPQVQRKLHFEIDSVLDTNRVAMTHTKLLPYVQATLDELQRIVNVLPWGIPHRATEDFCVGEFLVRAGTTLMPQYGAVHFDERHFPQPEQFRPERFLDEQNCYKKNPNLTPFGIGKRSCLGESLARAELFLVFVSLLQNFRFAAVGELPSLDRCAGMACVPKPYTCQIIKRRQKLAKDFFETHQN